MWDWPLSSINSQYFRSRIRSSWKVMVYGHCLVNLHPPNPHHRLLKRFTPQSSSSCSRSIITVVSTGRTPAPHLLQDFSPPVSGDGLSSSTRTTEPATEPTTEPFNQPKTTTMRAYQWVAACLSTKHGLYCARDCHNFCFYTPQHNWPVVWQNSTHLLRTRQKLYQFHTDCNSLACRSW